MLSSNSIWLWLLLTIFTVYPLRRLPSGSRTNSGARSCSTESPIDERVANATVMTLAAMSNAET